MPKKVNTFGECVSELEKSLDQLQESVLNMKTLESIVKETFEEHRDKFESITLYEEYADNSIKAFKTNIPAIVELSGNFRKGFVTIISRDRHTVKTEILKKQTLGTSGLKDISEEEKNIIISNDKTAKVKPRQPKKVVSRYYEPSFATYKFAENLLDKLKVI